MDAIQPNLAQHVLMTKNWLPLLRPNRAMAVKHLSRRESLTGNGRLSMLP
ncbi:MAG: hypothetical protein KatS3mg114_0980 [Planctomycetaceae bacterium]|nr:MAG: hypothetical protein KatS3mg114_0980 [Planctomycetaceae bacterium]